MLFVINQTEGYPESLRPGMHLSSICLDVLRLEDPKMLEELIAIVGVPLEEWCKRLRGKRALPRLMKVAVKLFGRSSCVQYVKLEQLGPKNSLFLSRIRVPDSV